LIIYILSFALLLAIDFITKYLAFAVFGRESDYFLIFKIKPMINNGIAFSAFSKAGSSSQFGLIVLTGIVITLFLFEQLKKYGFSKNIFPAILVASGGVGNFLNRIWFGGVIDFLEITFFCGQSSVLNLADIYIGVGLLIILIRTLFYEQA
jgi:signal peptidase II